MQLIDTHCHIYADAFDNDRPQMIQRALDNGVGRMLMPAIDSGEHDAMLLLEKQFPGQCLAMMGLHPCSVKEDVEEELTIVTNYFKQRAFLAVGEIGLDFYWDLSFKEQQLDAFHRQVELALHYNVPVVIHSRESTDECIRVVKEHQRGKLKGVFHCFSGTVEQAKQITDLGLYLGIGGVLTFKKSGLDGVIKEMELNKVVLETDDPYLAPVPFRGKRNECSYIKYVVQKLADIKQISAEEAAAVTTKNAEDLFGL